MMHSGLKKGVQYLKRLIFPGNGSQWTNLNYRMALRIVESYLRCEYIQKIGYKLLLTDLQIMSYTNKNVLKKTNCFYSYFYTLEQNIY